MSAAGEEEGAQTAALRCELASLKPLADALSCMASPSRAHDVQLWHSAADGLRLSTTAESHHASVILPPAAFTRLHAAPHLQQHPIRLNLSALQHALSALGALGARSAPVHLTFSDATLRARTAQPGCVVRVALAALCAPPSSSPSNLATSWRVADANAPPLAEFILGADALRDALNDVQCAGAELVRIAFEPHAPCVRLVAPAHARGDMACVAVELSRCTPRFQLLQCRRSCAVVVSTRLLLHTAPALQIADSVKLALSDHDVLTVVCKLRGLTAEHRTFVEFVLLPQERHSHHDEHHTHDDERHRNSEERHRYDDDRDNYQHERHSYHRESDSRDDAPRDHHHNHALAEESDPDHHSSFVF
ncbi:unnamed protein product, partial [Agarophyton chilense]|eukprot:gb/GEZJ01004070.1/.p1 GENE.gb/GEZJ01004070.1/~~gb/GEZJ01004070.1/.p1  ORF type:complete len:363 (+),score=57.76 gb/GEZJ01004070.1/:127-1215(+)